MAFNFLKSLDADDIFISYSREDGSAYLTGLDAALAARGFSCFTDKRGTDAGQLPPETLFRKIRLCKTLVLLATPGALKNPENMAMEVSEFAKANGTSRILCISFDRGTEFANWSDTPWYAHVEGKERGREDPNALTTGEPSPSIVDNIVRASDYMKSKDRLRRYRNRALAGFLCLLALGVVTGGFALYQLRRAGEERAIADSRSLANRSQILLRQHPEALPRALELAVSAMNESSAIGVHGVEADSALRESLALLPRLRSSEKYDRGAAVAFSPDGRHFAMLSSDNKLRIYDALSQAPLQARKPLRDIDCECSAVALSSGLAYAAAVTAKGIQVFDLQDGAHSHLVKIESGVSAEKIALSPGGRYLALSFDEGEDVGRLSKVMVLETAHGKLIKTLDDLHMLIHDIEFGPGGNLAAGGKYGSLQAGRFTGRVILWHLQPPVSRAEQELTDASFDDVEVIPQQGEVNAVVPGTDRTYFATDSGVWKRLSGRMDYEPIARFPYVRDFPSTSWVGPISFGPDGQSLVLARAIRTIDQGSNDLDEDVLEVWDLPGHWDLAHAFQPEEVTSVSFKPGEPLVLAMTEQPTQETPIRVFRAANGEPVDSIAFEPEPEGSEEKYASPGGDSIVYANQKVAVVWDVWGRRKRTAVFGDVLQRVEVATVSPGGKFLALSGPNKEGEPALFVFRLERESYRKWKSIPQADDELETSVAMSLSTDGQRLAVLYSYAEQFVRVWDVGSGSDVSPESLAKAGDVSQMALSQGGRFLVLADSDGETQLLGLSQGRKAKLIPLLDATSISSLAFSSDERYLGLGSYEGILYVFDTFRPEDEIARLQHTGAITAIAFSDDNRYLATASSDPHPYDIEEEESFPLRIWLLQPGDLIAEARERLAPFSK